MRLSLKPAKTDHNDYWLKTISVEIKAPGEYYVDGKRTSFGNLVKALGISPGSDMNRVRVLITPDDVPYEEATKVIDALQSAGVVKIGLISPNKDEQVR